MKALERLSVHAGPSESLLVFNEISTGYFFSNSLTHLRRMELPTLWIGQVHFCFKSCWVGCLNCQLKSRLLLFVLSHTVLGFYIMPGFMMFYDVIIWVLTCLAFCFSRKREITGWLTYCIFTFMCVYIWLFSSISLACRVRVCRSVVYGCGVSWSYSYKNIWWVWGWDRNYLPRSTIWYHEACQMMSNGYSKGRIFLSHTHTNNGFFSHIKTNRDN